MSTPRPSASALPALVCAAALLAASAGAHAPDSTRAHPTGAHPDKSTGLSHNNTTHHYRLLPDGGAIEVTAKDASDTLSRNAIRAHLNRVAQMLSAGDFSEPMLTREPTAPGTADMQRLGGTIHYRFEPLDGGGRVLIATRNARALVAIHDFLRFQITEHKTGDPLEVLSIDR
jgi:hypothetical protein